MTALRHPGSDDEGEYLDAHAALGACRLSLVDLAGGRQPIGNETGTVHAVLNGEIYNLRALRARLQQRSCSAPSSARSIFGALHGTCCSTPSLPRT